MAAMSAGEFAYRAGCYIALGLFSVFVWVAFREFSDPHDISGFIQFGVVISCVLWTIGSASRFVLNLRDPAYRLAIRADMGMRPPEGGRTLGLRCAAWSAN